MAISFITDCSKSPVSTDTPLPPTKVASMPLVRQESEKDQNRRREKAYRLYKYLSKPTKATMCSMIDYTKDSDITKQDVDLLPWNLEETKVITEAMLPPKTTEEKDKKTETKEKKKDKKVKERFGGEDTQDDRVRDDRLLTIKLVEEYKPRREETRLKREASKKNMPKVDTQLIRTGDDRPCQHKDVRRKRAFLWYTRLDMPTRRQFKRKVTATESINVTPRDIDLLPWNLTGRAVNMEKMKAMVRASVLKQ
jgi:hypothetical protein